MTPQEMLIEINKYWHDYGAFNEQDFYSLEGRMRDKVNLPSFSFDAGATKGVVIFQNENFVLKIPFTEIVKENHCYHSDSTENYSRSYWAEEGMEFCYAYKAGIIEFDDNTDCNWDYCRLESAIYKKAEEEGLGAYFAKEELIGYIGNLHPVYMQQKCKVFSEMNIDYKSQDYKEKSEISNSLCKKFNFSNFNSIWIADFIDMYGEYEFEKLVTFIRNYDIEDLRACNIGYFDGAPILFDYAGYRE